MAKGTARDAVHTVRGSALGHVATCSEGCLTCSYEGKTTGTLAFFTADFVGCICIEIYPRKLHKKGSIISVAYIFLSSPPLLTCSSCLSHAGNDVIVCLKAVTCICLLWTVDQQELKSNVCLDLVL